MSDGKIVLWRHGRTAHNVQRRFQGHIDIPLDATGAEQAASAGTALARLEPSAIVSSDLSRARQTAAALAAATDLDVTIDPRLRERSYGRWEGLDAAEIQAGFPEDFDRWRRGIDPVDSGVEGRQVASTRAMAAVQEHWGRAEGGTLVIVSHGGLITCLASALLGLNPSQWLGLRGLDNCHWAILAPNPGREPGWRLAGYNLGVVAER